MKRSKAASEDILDIIVDWQDTETGHVHYANREIPRSKNPLEKTMLKVIKLEAERNSLIQQMIVETVSKDFVNLTTEDLGAISGHINKYIDDEEKILSRAESISDKNESFMTRYLLSFLVSDLKHQNESFRQFTADLKTAQIPTSVSSKKARSSVPAFEEAGRPHSISRRK
jgi:hypothetical protein